MSARLAESDREHGAAFVELTAPVAYADAASVVVELSSADGAKLVIRAPSGESVDVLALAEAFWRRRA